jgi:Lipid A core - O-antigen ligase and related enzymes
MTHRLSTTKASRWTVGMLTLILLGLTHVAISNTGGSGADLPEALLVWCGITATIAGCAWSMARQTIALSFNARLMLAAAILLTIPLFWSPLPDWQRDALPRLAGLWAGMTLYVLLLNCHFSARQRQYILWLIAAAATLQTAYSLAGLWAPFLLPEAGRTAAMLSPHTGIGVFQQRNVTASFIATGAAVLLWLAADSRFTLMQEVREKWRRAAVFAAIVVMFMTLTLLESRTGWLAGLVIWGMFSGIFYRTEEADPHPGRWTVRCAPALGIAVGLGLMTGTITSALQDHSGSTLNRVFILQQTWQMIALHPLLGWGYGGFPWSFAHFIADRAQPLYLEMNELTHPHNELLFWWVEGGIVALGGILLLLAAGVMLFLRHPTRHKLALLGCLLPILIHTQLEYPLYQSPAHWLVVMILLSFADRLDAQERPHPGLFRRSSIRLLPCALTVLALCGTGLVGLTFWQNQVLIRFQQSPQQYASRVLKLYDTRMGSERLLKDRALSWIVRYQSSGNPDDLQRFCRLGRRWIATWSDPDIYHNLINVEQFLGNESYARQLRSEAQRLYPEDPRFS